MQSLSPHKPVTKEKKMTKFLISLFIGVSFLSSAAFAELERIPLKADEIKTKETAAKTNLKKIDLGSIEDQEARAAIKEILNYLNLSAKK